MTAILFVFLVGCGVLDAGGPIPSDDMRMGDGDVPFGDSDVGQPEDVVVLHDDVVLRDAAVGADVELPADVDLLPDAASAPDDGTSGHDGTDADIPQGDPDVEAPSTAELQRRAIDRLSELREMFGTTAVSGVVGLHQASQAHAECFAVNCEVYIDQGLSPHEEVPELPGFTGEQFWHRAAAAGYAMNGGWEVIAFVDDPELAIDQWMETLYHRIPLVHPNARDAGYGGAAIDDSDCALWGYRGVDVMDLGAGAASATDGPVMVPWDGQDDVPVRWLGNESPQPPPPPGDGYPSGPVVTLTFPTEAGAIAGGAHDLRGPGESAVPHTYLSPENDDYLSDTLSLYADDPLLPGATYTVTMDGTRGGEPFSYTWSFTTEF